MPEEQETVARLRRFLDEGNFREQDRLPSERELSAMLGLTRNQLRSGLKKLSDAGLVWRHVGKGTYFGPRVGGEAGFPVGTLADLTNPREVFEARLAFEPEMARLAAYRARGGDFAEIERCLEKTRTIADWDAWERWDTRLHRAIGQAAGNTLMLVLFDVVHANRNKDLWGKLRDPIEPSSAIERATKEHDAIIQAIRHREPKKAEDAMRKHLRSVCQRIFGEV